MKIVMKSSLFSLNVIRKNPSWITYKKYPLRGK